MLEDMVATLTRETMNRRTGTVLELIGASDGFGFSVTLSEEGPEKEHTHSVAKTYVCVKGRVVIRTHNGSVITLVPGRPALTIAARVHHHILEREEGSILVVVAVPGYNPRNIRYAPVSKNRRKRRR